MFVKRRRPPPAVHHAREPGPAGSSAQARPARRRLRTACACCLSTFVCLLLLATAPGGVSRDHLLLRQALTDRYYVALGRWSRARRGSSSSSRGGASPPPAASPPGCPARGGSGLAVHLKVPKAASTTLFDLVYALSGANAFSVESRPMYLDGARVNASAGEYAAFFAGLPADPPTLRTAHGPYLDYRWWGLQREPAYFGLARDPLARLASHYEYTYRGPRSAWARFWKGQDRGAPSFAECATRHARDLPSKDGCALHRFANTQLLYFCGVHPDCGAMERNAVARSGGAKALARAKANVERDFAAVGTVEQLPVVLNVLEHVLPAYFRGAPAAYAALGNARVNTARQAGGPPNGEAALPEDVERYLRDLLHWEQELYDWIALRGALQADRCRGYSAAQGPFPGAYADPEHPEGYRVVERECDPHGACSEAVTIQGKDAPGEATWHVRGRIVLSVGIEVDFSPKGGPETFGGTLVEDGGIAWADGNVWYRVEQS